MIKEGYFYTKEHEWVSIDGEIATVGVTDFAQSELGEIVFVELPKVGEKLIQNGSFCVLESTKAASDVYAPISGVVKILNPALTESPNLINNDPYGDGWLIKLEGISKSELESLMDATSYKAFISESE